MMSSSASSFNPGDTGEKKTDIEAHEFGHSHCQYSLSFFSPSRVPEMWAFLRDTGVSMAQISTPGMKRLTLSVPVSGSNMPRYK